DLSDTIWALKKEALTLTAVSDRLKIFIQRVQASYPAVSIDVEETIHTDHALSPSQGFHLFQTIREAVINALKHSGGNHILIDIQGETNEWKIIVSDNGSGMKNTSSTSGDGNGLFNMKNRTAEAGWAIEWAPNGEGGVSVILRQVVT
ncbi:MAG: ATP-binding protein, partial [Sediminibacterium sp.]